MNKEYWPTNEKIERLRENGIFSYSQFTTKLIQVIVLLCALCFFNEKIDMYFNFIRDFFAGNFNNDSKNIINLFLFIPIIMLPCIIGIILVHSRFLFTAKNLINTKWKISLFSKENRAWKVFLLSPLFIACYFLLVYLLMGEFLSILKNDYKDILFLIGSSLNHIFLLCIIVFSFFAIFSFCVNKFLFLCKNRMTKEEFQHEMKSEE